MIHAAIEAAATINVRPATTLMACPVNWPALPFIMAIPRPITTNTPIGNATSEMNQSPNSFNFVANVQLPIHHQQLVLY